jgi:hypothetical protein
MSNISFDTTEPSQVQGLNGWTVDPLFTVGEKIGDYAPPGILDGIGAYSLNESTVRLLVNHELASNDGYKYTLKNGTQLPGARVSYFDLDKQTLKITGSGLAFDTIINRAGEVVDAATDLEFGGLNRFCSSILIEANQFGAGNGLTDRIYFAGEETNGGTQFALDTKTNTLYAVPWFGRAAWENITEINTRTTNKVAFIIGDDRANAPLLLYVGDKNAKGNGSFLDRNGLAQGKLYVWVADDVNNATDSIERSPSEFKGSGAATNGKFVEIPYYDPTKANTTGYDAQGFATQAKQDELAEAAKAFKFSRPEDVATNPFDGTQVALASTGNSASADIWGTTYKIDVDFNNITAGNITAKIDILYDGNDAGKQALGLRSPDNLDWADDGKIYINEDRSIAADQFAGTGKIEASIFSIDPNATNPASTLTRIAQMDRSAVPAGQTDSSPTDLGNWETSGILDISTLLGNNPGEVFVFDVQAHSLRDGSIITATNVDGNNDGTRTRQENLVEGGQLSLFVAPQATLVQSTSLVSGTTRDDNLDAGFTKGFDGVNDIVFAGAGNDTIDVPIAGAIAGNNRISAGRGDDTIFAGNNDRVFGTAGDDEIDGTDAKGYRASGGAGDDVFFLGGEARALGGDGNDKFFVQSGGGNLLSGGAGKDQFWIVNGEIPSSANTILDFQIGTDVIGLVGAASLGITTSTLKLNQVGSDTAIVFGSQTLATLTGIQASSLSLTNPSQFVFA